MLIEVDISNLNKSNDGRCSTDIRNRVEMAMRASLIKKQLLTDTLFNNIERKYFVKMFVYGVILYGCERWTSLTCDRKRLGAVEMWIWRQMITEKQTKLYWKK